MVEKELLMTYHDSDGDIDPNELLKDSSSSDDDKDLLQDDMGIDFKLNKKKAVPDSLEEKRTVNDQKGIATASKYQNKIHLGKIEKGPNLSHSVFNSIKDSHNKEDFSRNRVKDKEDRATVEQVLDPRTRVILVKMLNKKFIREINGCLSTGKEANVYHAISYDGTKEFAIKIYKTSILIFKDRERYVGGEFRFRNGHCKSNPRKMIKLWAEKEIRNLKRIHQSSINCPEPLFVKSNVLVMGFVGKEMVPGPRLRDVDLDTTTLSEVYLDLLIMMRTLFHDCRLIHADLSEYNLLYWEGKLYMIDVSQSIEHDHPSALDFLRRDILNVNNYFKKKGVIVFGLRQVFDFITDINIKKGSDREILEDLIKNPQEDKEEDEKVFAGVYIPRTLQEVPLKKQEEDLFKKGEDILYKKLTGAAGTSDEPIKEQKKKQKKGVKFSSDPLEEGKNNCIAVDKIKPEPSEKPTEKKQEDENTSVKDTETDHSLNQSPENKVKESSVKEFKEVKIEKGENNDKSSDEENDNDDDDSGEDESRSGSEEGSGGEGDEENEEERIKKQGGIQKYEGLSKKERKQKVKEEKREKRKTKIPKHLKKQLIKKHKSKAKK